MPHAVERVYYHSMVCRTCITINVYSSLHYHRQLFRLIINSSHCLELQQHHKLKNTYENVIQMYYVRERSKII